MGKINIFILLVTFTAHLFGGWREDFQRQEDEILKKIYKLVGITKEEFVRLLPKEREIICADPSNCLSQDESAENVLSLKQKKEIQHILAQYDVNIPLNAILQFKESTKTQYTAQAIACKSCPQIIVKKTIWSADKNIRSVICAHEAAHFIYEDLTTRTAMKKLIDNKWAKLSEKNQKNLYNSATEWLNFVEKRADAAAILSAGEQEVFDYMQNLRHSMQRELAEYVVKLTLSCDDLTIDEKNMYQQALLDLQSNSTDKVNYAINQIAKQEKRFKIPASLTAESPNYKNNPYYPTSLEFYQYNLEMLKKYRPDIANKIMQNS